MSAARVAAFFIAGVLTAGLAVGGLLIVTGASDGEAAADARPGAASPAPTGSEDSAAPSAAPSRPPGDPDLDRVPFVALRTGECFDHPALDPTVDQVETRPCDGAHDGEVIAGKTLTGSFTSERTLRKAALDLCEPAVKRRMRSIPEDGRQYFSYALYPSLDTYRTHHETRVSCALTLSLERGGTKLTARLPG